MCNHQPSVSSQVLAAQYKPRQVFVCARPVRTSHETSKYILHLNSASASFTYIPAPCSPPLMSKPPPPCCDAGHQQASGRMALLRWMVPLAGRHARQALHVGKHTRSELHMAICCTTTACAATTHLHGLADRLYDKGVHFCATVTT